MSDIRIEVYPGDYGNTDVYQKVLGYISDKAYFGGFGFSPNLSLSIIEQFQLSEQYSKMDSPQKLWHFCITFSKAWDHTTLLKMAIWISSIFAPQYQVLYALDLERNHKPSTPHLHFCANAFSYHPDSPPLLKELMKNYIEMIQKTLTNQYSPLSVTLQFQGKGA